MENSSVKIVAIGIYNSQVAVKHSGKTKHRRSTMFELELPIENGGISYIDKQATPITPNTFIVGKPGNARHTKLPFKCYYVHLIVKNGLLEQKLNSLPNFIFDINYENYEKIFMNLCKYYQTGVKEDEILIYSLLFELIYSLLKGAKNNSHNVNEQNNNKRIIEKTIEFIDNNPMADLSLKAMSQLAGFSFIHFHNCFKSCTGKTLRDYVEEQRIKKAINLLISTNKTLAEIAYESGFSSQSYFNYAFRRRMKKTPREYVKSLANLYDCEHI